MSWHHVLVPYLSHLTDTFAKSLSKGVELGTKVGKSIQSVIKKSVGIDTALLTRRSCCLLLWFSVDNFDIVTHDDDNKERVTL